MDTITGLEEILELLKVENPTTLISALQVLMNAAMVFERQKALGASPYERSEDRTGYANGFKPRTLSTRMGALHLKVPQTRGIEFYPSMLEKGQRSERAFMAALAEMYVQGTSTRKVDLYCQLWTESSQADFLFSVIFFGPTGRCFSFETGVPSDAVKENLDPWSE